MEFFYKDSVRWSFGLNSPNEAAFLIAGALPLLWAATESCYFSHSSLSRRVLLTAVICISGLAWWGLACTYSRGGYVGALCGMAFFFWVVLWRSASRRCQWMIGFWPILLIMNTLALLGALYFAGLGQRFQDISSGDPSAWNRISLWCGGIQLLGASPFHAWGVGETGIAYMQWIQDPADGLVYGGMVNSYLTLVLEHGVLALFVVLAAIIFVLLTAADADCSRLTQSMGAAAAAFAVASFFSTFWNKMHLVIVFALVVSFVSAHSLVGRNLCRFKRNSIIACISSLVICSTVACTAYLTNALSRSRITQMTDGSVVLHEPGTNLRNGRDSLIICVDDVTLGRFYGREIRKALEPLKGWGQVRVYRKPLMPPDREKSRGVIVLLGDRVRQIDRLHADDKVVLICPISEKGREIAKNVAEVYVPEIPICIGRINWTASTSTDRRIIQLEGIGRVAAPCLTEILRGCLALNTEVTR